ncbi:hypothetical protein DM813_12615 [Pseudomonas alkylphenolica]|uniref:Uncharacterized protein n=1 Tax=Pseudomonas alkylphenolica TaxID=237609 RepID=A0A443ZTI3_9PSED|nr:hypothetical protein [Pseudomonas alkylphenolica]RWU23033.1 hypothetical protein DM813_12615 [Pseudomonas alkylphenolica]
MIWAVLVIGVLFLSIIGIGCTLVIFSKDEGLGKRVLISVIGVSILAATWNGTGWLVENLK